MLSVWSLPYYNVILSEYSYIPQNSVLSLLSLLSLLGCLLNNPPLSSGRGGSCLPSGSSPHPQRRGVTVCPVEAPYFWSIVLQAALYSPPSGGCSVPLRPPVACYFHTGVLGCPVSGSCHLRVVSFPFRVCCQLFPTIVGSSGSCRSLYVWEKSNSKREYSFFGSV